MLKLVIDVNLNIPALGKAFGDAVQAILPAIETARTKIMGKIEDLEQKTDTLVANVTELRQKTGVLIVANEQVVTALTDLRNSQDIPPAIAARIDAIIAKQTDAIGQLDLTDLEVDAAAARSASAAGSLPV